jgi:hypothetical protein
LQVYDPKTGDFGLAEPTTERSVGYISALLKDGRVLIVGGSSAELFDPATGKFRATGSMTTSRTDSTTYLKTGPTATLLKDGRVLIAGGSDGSNSLSSAELYDPATGKFGRTGSMTAGREDAVAIRLADGRVLVVGGRKVGLKVGLIPSLGSRCQALASAETYDPGTGKFSPTGWMAAGCSGYAIALLSDGRVLVAGGWDDYNNRALASAELFMP